MVNDLQSVAYTLGGLSITGGSTIKEAKRMRANLPIPRETRDQIYGYLLYHEHAHDQPYHVRSAEDAPPFSVESRRFLSIAYTYRFHPNILAVNRQMSKEALQVLLSNNFIVLSHRFPGLSKFIHRLGLPVITESQDHVARFAKLERHVLRVHVQSGPDVP